MCSGVLRWCAQSAAAKALVKALVKAAKLDGSTALYAAAQVSSTGLDPLDPGPDGRGGRGTTVLLGAAAAAAAAAEGCCSTASIDGSRSRAI